MWTVYIVQRGIARSLQMSLSKIKNYFENMIA